ncbi:MAG: histidine phosphatase family protein [Pseudomonadota bacterium]
MASFPKIWFLRHGQTQWNLERRLQGRLDSPLTDLGREQAAQQAVIMRPVLEAAPDIACLVSPQGRAVHTAEIALSGHKFTTDPRLAEVATGEWEGQLRAELPTGGLNDLFLYTSAPGGEGFDALEARVRGVLDDLQGETVIVSHGLLGKVLRGLVRGLAREEMDELSNKQGCVYVLEKGRETCLEG